MTDDERNAAMRFAKDAYAVAQQRVQSAPLALTEDDFDQLHIVSPALERDAREALRQAQLAVVQQRAVTTKSLPAARTSTANQWDGAAETIVTLIAANINPAKDRIAALERRNAELEARVLELEAQHAASSKVDVV